MHPREVLIFFGCLVTAVILHEISHGVVALWFGDDTAKRAGRLTLNPIPHIDPFGSLILPAMGALTGLPILGYAKPVPVNPARLRNPRRDMVFVSLAGPATNFTLMAIAAFAARWVYHHGGVLGNGLSGNGPDVWFDILYVFAFVNFALGLFNLLPIPPLDGSALVERVLPRQWLPGWYRYRTYGFLVLFGIVFFAPAVLSSVLDPFLNALQNFVIR